MKNILNISVGLALLFAAAFTTAQPASEFVGTPQTQGGVTCYQESTSTTVFPGNKYWYCGTSEPTYGHSAFGDLGTIGAQGKSVLLSGGLHFFVFADVAHFKTFCTGTVTSPPMGTPLIPSAVCTTMSVMDDTYRGLSLVGGTFAISVIVESDVWAPSPVPNTINENSFPFIPFTSEHEAGHHQDHFFAGTVTHGSTSYVSASTSWNNMIAKDKVTINAKDSANPLGFRNGCDKITGSGLFLNLQDTYGQFICASSGAGSGVNTGTTADYLNTDDNITILEKAWPTIYKASMGAPTPYFELAASLFAVSNGNKVLGPRVVAGTRQEAGGFNSAYLDAFACSLSLVKNLQINGTVVLCP
jgi:hypothetical protein